jgi:hypothetical protein
VAASASPASLSNATSLALPAGRYVTDGPFDPRLVLTLPEGWKKNDYNAGRVSLLKPADDGMNAAFVTFYLVSGVYADPCAGGPPLAPRRDAEVLVTALRSQPGFEIGFLSEGTLDGMPSWTWEVTPTVDPASCAHDPWLYQWQYPGTADSSVDAGTIAGAVQRLTVIDFDGTPIIAEVGTFEWTSEADALEANAMADNVEFQVAPE